MSSLGKARFRVWMLVWISFAVVGVVILVVSLMNSNRPPQQDLADKAVQIIESEPEPEPEMVDLTSTTEPSIEDLLSEFSRLPLADAHNHGSVLGIEGKLPIWEKLGVDRVVLFGEVSRQMATLHDMRTWTYYQQNPDLVIPFFAGINLKDPDDLQVARDLLEMGYFGIGEIAGASTNSPAVSDAEWKATDPMDGILPRLYELCAEYKVPVLLHVDPPFGYPILMLEEALEAYPDTAFIFAHANAYNSPENIEELLKEHENLYIDFFAGSTAFNPRSANKLEDFVDVIRAYPDRFMISSDSGYDIERGEEQAIEAMYMMLDLLKDDPVLVRQVAYDNLDALIRDQPATTTQKAKIAELNKMIGSQYDVASITKLEAGKILSEMAE